ncbi:MAG: lytic transglycosylase domain-containing protein [Acidimicrobiales bacterium]|nr:lytic transglycosylase domain-containing protein [Chloroflexota bacterium]
MLQPSALALLDIPSEFLDLYRRAAESCPGLAWTVLAAIGSIESAHGRSQTPGVHAGTNEAGAMGPMQFLGTTWADYGTDGGGDGRMDVYDPADAIFGAARYLCASGAATLATLPAAVWAYNHADWYVEEVLVLAGAYGLVPSPSVTPAEAAALVDHPNLTLTPEARHDLLTGSVDSRVVELLATAVETHRMGLSVFRPATPSSFGERHASRTTTRAGLSTSPTSTVHR